MASSPLHVSSSDRSDVSYESLKTSSSCASLFQTIDEDLDTDINIDKTRLFPPPTIYRKRSSRNVSPDFGPATLADSHNSHRSPSSSTTGVSYQSYHDSLSDGENATKPGQKWRRGLKHCNSMFSISTIHRARTPFIDFPIWSSYPSHLQDERVNSANDPSQIIVRDFCPQTDNICPKFDAYPEPGPSSFHQIIRKKTHAMFTRLSNRLYRSTSSEVGRYRAGLHSHIGRGGIVEYPELEILPPGAILTVARERVGGFRVMKSSTTLRKLAVAQVDSESRRDARKWADYYQDCLV